MDDTKIDAAIAFKKKKIEKIDADIVSMQLKKKELMAAIEELKKKKAEAFSRALMDGLSKEGVPLDRDTLQNILALMADNSPQSAIAADHESDVQMSGADV